MVTTAALTGTFTTAYTFQCSAIRLPTTPFYQIAHQASPHLLPGAHTGPQAAHTTRLMRLTGTTKAPTSYSRTAMSNGTRNPTWAPFLPDTIYSSLHGMNSQRCSSPSAWRRAGAPALHWPRMQIAFFLVGGVFFARTRCWNTRVQCNLSTRRAGYADAAPASFAEAQTVNCNFTALWRALRGFAR